MLSAVAPLPFDAGVALALLLLLAAALYDARTGIVPDGLIYGAALLLLCFGLAGPGLTHLLPAAATALLVYGFFWLLNEVWYRLRGEDAIGLGDAKWSAAASLAVGPWLVLLGWLAGAVLAVLWLWLARLCGRRLGLVYFVPFIAAGMLLARSLGLG